jgi:hypothetical protein
MIDWPSYNQSLVRRGQVLLDYDVLEDWDHELSQMNHGKVVNLTPTQIHLFSS